jgi:exodeoxyribonuclease-3
MRIATYTVNGINGRLANLLGWLQEAAPDIVCLQELKAPDEKFPAAALGAAGYGAVWHGQKSWNGVAILARGSEPVETRRGLPGERTAATSKRRSTEYLSDASICRTAIRHRDQNSTTSCAGSIG